MDGGKQSLLFLLAVVLSMLLMVLVVERHRSSLFDELRVRSDNDSMFYSGSGMSPDDNYTYNGTVIPPTPSPGVNPTCLALQRLVSTTRRVCTTSDQCTGIHCQILTFGSMDLSVEPCSNPPAVHVLILDQNGNELVNQNLTQTKTLPVFTGVTITFTIEQSPNEDSITIQVDATVLGQPVPLVPQTTIPLNRAQCGFTPHTVTPHISTHSVSVTISQMAPSTTHSTPSHHSTHTHSLSIRPSPSVVVVKPTGATSQTAVAVAVPITIVLVLLVAVVIVVAIALVMKRHKRRQREYHFQRMTFSDDRDDDDDEDL